VGKEKNEMQTKFLLERLMGDQLEDTDLGGRIMLRWILRKLGWRVWIEFI
jgi:hypothetical protein